MPAQDPWSATAPVGGVASPTQRRGQAWRAGLHRRHASWPSMVQPPAPSRLRATPYSLRTRRCEARVTGCRWTRDTTPDLSAPPTARARVGTARHGRPESPTRRGPLQSAAVAGCWKPGTGHGCGYCLVSRAPRAVLGMPAAGAWHTAGRRGRGRDDECRCWGTANACAARRSRGRLRWRHGTISEAHEVPRRWAPRGPC